MLSVAERNRRNRFIGRHWLEAFNRKELERLLALYTDDAEHFSHRLKMRRPETKGLIKGKAELRTWFADALAIPTLHYEPTSITADGDVALLEYVRSVAGEQDLHVSEVLRILNGKITSSSVLTKPKSERRED